GISQNSCLRCLITTVRHWCRFGSLFGLFSLLLVELTHPSHFWIFSGKITYSLFTSRILPTFYCSPYCSLFLGLCYALPVQLSICLRLLSGNPLHCLLGFNSYRL